LKSRGLFFISVLPLISLMMFGAVQFVNASPALGITLAFDKFPPVYTVGEFVSFQGDLTWDGSPVTDGIVGLQIDDPNDEYFIFRTLPTGTPPAEGWKIEILDVIPCDSEGNPKQVFLRDKNAYFHIFYRNNDEVSRFVRICVNIFDVYATPLYAVVKLSTSIEPGTSQNLLFPWWVPEEAPVGNGTIHVSAFSELPRNLGYPYCPEKSAMFTIESESGMISYPPSSEGTYNLTFKLPSAGEPGTYDICATTTYNGEWGYTSKMFRVELPSGLTGDINKDGKVNILDAILLASAFGSKPGEPNWDIRCDLNKDDKVNILDAIILAANFGKSS
jgi:hypothetical protein